MSKRTKKRVRNTQRPASQAKQTSQSSQPVHKVRGGWLTAVLVFIIIDGIFSAVLLLAVRKSDGPPLPVLITVAILAALASIISAVAMWLWKRWGLNLYIVSTFAAIFVGLVFLPSPITAFHGIIPLGVLGFVLSSQKKLQLLE